jgi:tetratricopeptide (TPR) repeat protein
MLQMLERCDAARFAPGSYGGERLLGALNEAEGLLVELESGWRRRGGRTSGAGLALVLVALGGLSMAVGAGRAQTPAAAPKPAVDASAGGAGGGNARGTISGSDAVQLSNTDFTPPADLLQHGHAAYEAGRFQEAITDYVAAERAGVRNGALYYDLGNAYYKNGDLGHAVASYRRAEMLSPRDPQLRSNLDFVLAHREDKAMQAPDLWLVAQVRHMFRWLSLNEWIAVCGLLYVLTCCVMVVRILGRGHPAFLKHVLYVTVSALFVTAAITTLKMHAVRGVHRGVVSPSKVSVMSGPGLDYTAEFSLHEGAEVQIEAERPQWLRVSLGGKLRGWVPANSIIPI